MKWDMLEVHMKNTTVKEIMLVAKIGAELHASVFEAAIFALSYGITAKVIHNEKTYTVDPKAIGDMILSQKEK